MKRIKLFTHTDLDGVGCEIALRVIESEAKIDVEYCGYDNVDDKVRNFILDAKWTEYDEIYITDISVNAGTAALIGSTEWMKSRLKLLDHHKTALWLNEEPWAKVAVDIDGVKTCGAELLLNELDCGGQKLSQFVELVRLYDTWIWKAIGELFALELNDLYHLLGKKTFVKDMLQIICYGDYSNFSISDKHVFLMKVENERKERYISDKLKQVNVCENCSIVYAEQYTSELGNRMCREFPQGDFAVIVDIGKGTVSLRTERDDVDVSAIAKTFGGGGHQKAAGYPLSDEIANNMWLMYKYRRD